MVKPACVTKRATAGEDHNGMGLETSYNSGVDDHTSLHM